MKFSTKDLFRKCDQIFRLQISSKNSKLFQSFCSGRMAEMHPDPKDEGPIVIGHKITMILDTRKSNFESQ